MVGPTRDDVETRWQQLIDGTLTREEVHTWSAPWVEGEADFDDLIVGLGLQYLHGFDLSHPPDADGLLHHGGGPGRVYLRSTDDIAAELDRWREDARAFDEDPRSWQRGRFERLHESLLKEGRLEEAGQIERLIELQHDERQPPGRSGGGR